MSIDDIHAKRLYRDAIRVLTILEEEGYKARLAGGCVRDRQLNLPPKDYDVATNAVPEEVCSIFKQKSLKVVPTGIEHGTVTVVMPAGPVEITTLRRDVKTYGRHADVEFGSSFEADAERRDFTINAMFEDKQGVIYDFFGGLDHLKQKQLCFVGDAHQRIKEDYLRIMRFFRFWARFHLHPDPQAILAITSEVDGLQQVSQERITSELMGLLQADNPIPSLQSMVTTGTLAKILPEISLTENSLVWHQLHELKIDILPKQPLARLACLFYKQFTLEEMHHVAHRLRLSNKDQQDLVRLLSYPPELPPENASDASKMAFIDRCGEEGSVFQGLYAPFWLIVAPELTAQIQSLVHLEEKKSYLRLTVMPVTGHDVMQQLGITSGPELGQLLVQLKDSFRNGEWTEKAAGLRKAQELWHADHQ